MAALRLSDQLRKRLDALLSDDRGDPGKLLATLRSWRADGDRPVFSALLHALAHLEVPEIQAERLVEDLVAHRGELTRALGRDPGLRVAAIDYLSNRRRLLVNPTIVERADLERTERSAVTDPLTRLFNRRYFGRALALEARRSHRYSLRLSLLMLDVDEFKRINDRFGHLFGDLVLQRVGQVLRRTVRDADTPCRYGGEEFAVILPETDRLGGYAVAERIRQGVHRSFADKLVRGRRIDVSLSGGVASYPVDGEDPPALIARADRALYLAKELGKDRISLYHSERRRAIRYPAKPTCRARLCPIPAGPAAGARPINLSRHGALLDLDGPPSPLARVELTFDGRDGAGRPRHWTAPARVVRVERPPVPGAPARVAVAFEQPLPDECVRQQVHRASPLRLAQGGRR